MGKDDADDDAMDMDMDDKDMDMDMGDDDDDMDKMNPRKKLKTPMNRLTKVHRLINGTQALSEEAR